MTSREDTLTGAEADDGCPAAAPDLTDQAARAAWLLGGPRGLGTSGSRVPRLGLGLGLLPFTEREWGDGSYPPLYCPPAVRVDEALGAEVDRRLTIWAARCGLYAGRLEEFTATGFGRLAMLAHADVDDPDLLLVAAQMNAAWWASDDYYADDTSLGATPTELPPRLALVMSALDPPPDVGPYTRPLEEAISSDPVLVALRSAAGHLARHATSAQVQRAVLNTYQVYVSWTAYAAWRYLDAPPPVWRYLAARQHDSFYLSMTLIDAVAAYELPAELFAHRGFRTALRQAGTASVLVNDLHSAEREAADPPPANLVLLIAAEDGCTRREASTRTVALHNQLTRDFERSCYQLTATIAVPQLHAFLRGAQAWMAGCLEWHATTNRYTQA